MEADNDLDRITICRSTRKVHFHWQVISNPSWDYFTRAASTVLLNASNSYVEYENCGVIYRLVRRKDLAWYGIDPETAVGLSQPDQHMLHSQPSCPTSVSVAEVIQTAKLESIRISLHEYHEALKNREHGAIAADRFIQACQEILDQQPSENNDGK